ncbi:sensor histidine kinase [Stenotrophomonas acidaminiphila]
MPRTLPAWLRPAPDSVVADNIKLGRWPWLDAIHLLWTVWVFATPLFAGGYTWRWAWITLASYPVFVLLYVMTLVSSRRHVPIYAIGMVVLGISLLSVYPSAISYFVFGCVGLRINRCISTTRYLAELLALNAVFVAQTSWIGYPWQAIAWVPVLSIIIGLIVSGERSGHEKDAALRLSHEEVRRLAATAERERIGRDLHDLLGHTLSLITLKMELSRKLFERDPARAQRELAEAEQIARDALAQVRSAVTGFRAADMAAEIASAHLLLESSRVHLRHSPPPPMPGWIECGLAMVLREAVTNIARHAQASEAMIALRVEAGVVVLDVADDGRGGVSANGNGLAGMRERVAALGGTLQIDSPRGAGTRLTVTVPLGDAGAGDAAVAAPVPGSGLPAMEARA